MKKILIVDDKNQNLYMMQTLLEGHGYEVIQANNGLKAINIARDRPPDLIITDVLMPVMDGYSLCREWMKDKLLQNIPFIFYTATDTDAKDERFGLSLGSAKYLIKPMDPNRMIEIVNEVIENPKGKPAGIEKSITEETLFLKEYNEALIRKLEKKLIELEESNIELLTFLYRSNHEIRGPLATLNGLFNLLITEGNNDFNPVAPMIQKTLENLNDNIKSINIFYYVRNRNIKFKKFAIRPLLESFKKTYKKEIDEEHINFIIDLKQDIKMNSDQKILGALISELVKNAIHFHLLNSTINPYIKLTASIDNNQAVIEVDDNGVGIDQEYEKEIFKMFVRCHTKSLGSGLGLYIAKIAAEKIKATISLVKKKEPGAMFNILLPYKLRKERHKHKNTTQNEV